MTYSIALSPEEMRLLIKALEDKLYNLPRHGADASEMKQVLKRTDELRAAK